MPVRTMQLCSKLLNLCFELVPLLLACGRHCWGVARAIQQPHVRLRTAQRMRKEQRAKSNVYYLLKRYCCVVSFILSCPLVNCCACNFIELAQLYRHRFFRFVSHATAIGHVVRADRCNTFITRGIVRAP